MDAAELKTMQAPIKARYRDGRGDGDAPLGGAALFAGRA